MPKNSGQAGFSLIAVFIAMGFIVVIGSVAQSFLRNNAILRRATEAQFDKIAKKRQLIFTLESDFMCQLSNLVRTPYFVQPGLTNPQPIARLNTIEIASANLEGSPLTLLRVDPNLATAGFGYWSIKSIDWVQRTSAFNNGYPRRYMTELNISGQSQFLVFGQAFPAISNTNALTTFTVMMTVSADANNRIVNCWTAMPRKEVCEESGLSFDITRSPACA